MEQTSLLLNGVPTNVGLYTVVSEFEEIRAQCLTLTKELYQGIAESLKLHGYGPTQLMWSDNARAERAIAGISGGHDGTYSVAISGGYDDDVDCGYAFPLNLELGYPSPIPGGWDLKGTAGAPKNLRTALQSSDQDFENNYNTVPMCMGETHFPA
ncbi:hypothetical protein B0H14DRAFT_2564639 [Mycena olivaceomarginata]|nr:hypothetical protein B0H14DRAFT_2564639 [Mycena olivaceomarginata]